MSRGAYPRLAFLEKIMIDIKNVIKIGAERIKYRNAEGNEAYIELAASANVWAHRHADAPSGELRTVADKYVTKNGVYLEFYNIGHTKLGVKAPIHARLFGKGVSAKQAGKLEALERELAANGWGVHTV